MQVNDFGKIIFLLAVVCLPRLSLAEDAYLSKDEALEIVLGKDCHITYERRALDEAVIRELKRIDAAPDGPPESHVFKCARNGRVAGYAFIDQQIGKHAPITFIVGVSPEGAVTGSEIMVYRELYGSQVKEKNFLSQFDHKDGTAALRIGRDIKHVTGATLSSLAIAKGVRRELALWRLFFADAADA